MHVVAFALCGVMPVASALAHTFHSAGPGASAVFWRLDFLGIWCLWLARAACDGLLAMWCARGASVPTRPERVLAAVGPRLAAHAPPRPSAPQTSHSP